MVKWIVHLQKTGLRLEDGYKKGLFTLDEFINFIEQKQKDYSDQVDSGQRKYTKELFDKLSEYRNETPVQVSKNIVQNDLYAMQN